MEIPSLTDEAGMGLSGGSRGEGGSRGKRRERKRIEEHYRLGEELGKGAFGVVCKATNLETGQVCACKMIDKAKAGAAGMSEIFSEVEIISLLNHRYIIQLVEVFETREMLHLIMELLYGGELQSRLRRQGHFCEATTKRLVRNMVLAVEYMHRKGVVHRDLKPANMLLASDHEGSEVKIADFGFAVLIGSDACLLSCCGTTAFMAPEIHLGEAYGKAVDMWSVGVIIYYMLCDDYPFAGTTNEEMTDNIVKGNYRIPEDGVWADITYGAKDVIRRLLQVDPGLRMTAGECLNHPWVRNGAEDDLDLMMQLDEIAELTELKHTGNRWKRCVIAVMTVHRFMYFHRVQCLQRHCIEIPLLYNFHCAITKQFDCREVDCGGGGIGNRGLPVLLEMMHNSPNVESLSLQANDLNYDSIQHIVKLASAHPSLAHLDLGGNPITQTGGRALLRLARSAHRIRHINLRGTQVNMELVTQINAALKDNEKKKPRLTTPLPSMPTGRGGSTAHHSGRDASGGATLPFMPLNTIRKTHVLSHPHRVR